MTWLEQWRSISARIDGLTKASDSMGTALGAGYQDRFGVLGNFLRPEIAALRELLVRFGDNNRHLLPPEVSDALLRFNNSPVNKELTNERWGLSLAVPFQVLRAEIDYLLTDKDQRARDLTELAFAHLERLIAVDDACRNTWQKAFRQGETHCERLGAVHLLHHGIWAVKVSARGAQTDLVYGSPLDTLAAPIRRTARALVLTEWKVARTPAEANQKAAAARRQAELYKRGLLSDLTLESTRFVVVVSEKHTALEDTVSDNDVAYRQISLPVDPDVPSKARRQSRRKPPAA